MLDTPQDDVNWFFCLDHVGSKSILSSSNPSALTGLQLKLVDRRLFDDDEHSPYDFPMIAWSNFYTLIGVASATTWSAGQIVGFMSSSALVSTIDKRG